MDLSTGGLLVVLFAAIALIVFLIVVLKMHGALALTIAAISVALVTGVELGNIGDLLEAGVGSTLGFLVLIIGFGAVLGKLLDVSGGAERLAISLLNVFGVHRAPIVMALLGLIAGIPVFVEVGFVLLVPLVFVVAKKARVSTLYVGVPLIVSLMAVHCLLPPHPAATAVSQTLGADVGQVILVGLLVALPTVLIGGPLYMRVVLKQEALELVPAGVHGGSGLGGELNEPTINGESDEVQDLPGFGITVFTILLPLLLMVARTVAESTLEEGNALLNIMLLIGHPIIALLISVLFAYWSLGVRRGIRLDKLSDITDSSFAPIASVLLIIGAGGAFNAVLTESGVAPAIADALSGWSVNPLILAWIIAMVLHFAVGSATVAMISAAGIVAPMLIVDPSLSPVLLVLAVGAGAMGLTHVTDSLFWLYKEYMGISVGQAYKTLTGGTTVASVTAMASILLVDLII
ncbi:GntT/GntP/DsdX family permease [Flaviflexus massiliensis]|uniref:GntT/GntP/DsdX family permease n=1 Tax=Flaviflexus massiliensis TaxID=1522309 RepID=UPI0006D578EF|nr:gluconate:H+ symporter [Flaviflexus massiliensis]